MLEYDLRKANLQKKDRKKYYNWIWSNKAISTYEHIKKNQMVYQWY